MSKEIMQQALDALKLHLTHHEHGCVYLNPIMYALEAELAKPEQTYDHESDAMSVLADVNADLIQDAKPEPVNRSWLSKGNPANAPVRNSGAPPKPEQEPVRWFQQFGDAPPRKPWVGLTDDEIKKIMQRWRNGYIDIKDVEQLLKDKNI